MNENKVSLLDLEEIYKQTLPQSRPSTTNINIRSSISTERRNFLTSALASTSTTLCLRSLVRYGLASYGGSTYKENIIYHATADILDLPLRDFMRNKLRSSWRSIMKHLVEYNYVHKTGIGAGVKYRSGEFAPW